MATTDKLNIVYITLGIDIEIYLAGAYSTGGKTVVCHCLGNY